jgi:S1-C subfamily serine protease
MRVVLSALLLSLLPALAFAQPGAPGAANLLANEKAITDIAERIEPTVVNVRGFVRDEKWWAALKSGKEKLATGWRVVPKQDLLYPQHRPLTGASGFLVSPDGYVLTLNRVVLVPGSAREADIVDIEVGPSHFTAKIVAREPTIDLAILKLTAPIKLPFALLGNSGVLHPGGFLLAFGNPDGPERILLPGLVASPPNRECYQEELSATYLQTSMTFEAGVLGGPIVDASGKVVGIATRRGDSGSKGSAAGGPGFALPINLASAIYEPARAPEQESPWLGVSVLLLSKEARRTAGAPDSLGILIDNVFAPSPAATLGIKIGDVLVRMNGEPIRTVYDFQRVLYAAGVGQVALLELIRGKAPLEITARVEKRPPEATTR